MTTLRNPSKISQRMKQVADPRGSSPAFKGVFFLPKILSSMPTTRYTPDTFEQECICLLYKWLAENSFQNPDLPPIYLSFETPPQFINRKDWHKIFEGDMIWDNWDGDDKQKKEFDDKLKKYDLTRQQIFSIDEVLGLYCPQGVNKNGTPEIVLYAQGITAVAKRLNVPTEMLRAVVLVHEIGHWISYEIQHNNSVKSSILLSNIGEESEDAKEMWAQIFPHWVAEEIQGLFKQAFELLNTNQRDAYHTYESFIEETHETILDVLKNYHRGIEGKQKISKCEKYEKYLDSEKLKNAMLKNNIDCQNISKVTKNSGIF